MSLKYGSIFIRVAVVASEICSSGHPRQHSTRRLSDRLSVACYCFSTQPTGLR